MIFYDFMTGGTPDLENGNQNLLATLFMLSPHCITQFKEIWPVPHQRGNMSHFNTHLRICVFS